MRLRDRIKELRRVRAGDLLPHPSNWRTHPREQRDALRGVLAEIGYADALVVRETPAGLQILDGHCRAEETPDAIVPVLVVDLDDAEAAKFLATHDPLGAMAEADAERLGEVLGLVESQNAAVQAMLESLGRESGACVPEFPATSADDQGRLDETGQAPSLAGGAEPTRPLHPSPEGDHA